MHNFNWPIGKLMWNLAWNGHVKCRHVSHKMFHITCYIPMVYHRYACAWCSVQLCMVHLSEKDNGKKPEVAIHR